MASLQDYSVLIVPGSWHVPAHYEALVKDLESKGVQASAILLPTCNVSHASVLDLKHPDLAGAPPSKPWPDMYDDARAVQENLARLLAKGKKILLVAHSYGGLPAAEALTTDYCLKTRKRAGKLGGVVGLVALASFFMPEGLTTVDAVGGKPLPETPKQPSGLYIVLEPQNKLFNDLEPAERDRWTSMLRPQPWSVAESPQKNAGYLNVPCAYVKATKDMIVPIDRQDEIIKGARGMGASVEEYSVDAGHDAFIGQPERCAEAIVSFARRCAQQAE